MNGDVDELILTREGADMIRACGCRERLDPDWDAWFVVEVCREHCSIAEKTDVTIPRITDIELDHYVGVAAGGHRVQRIRPTDPTKR